MIPRLPALKPAQPQAVQKVPSPAPIDPGLSINRSPSLPWLAPVDVGSFNFQVELTEQFANRFFAHKTTDQGPVRDCVLGADVQGEQQTEGATRINFVPSESSARAMLLLEGTSRNQTRNVTPQAAVCARGEYRFDIRKQVDFDGRQFQTRSPAAYLQVHQEYQGAETPFSQIPLLGPLANSIALSSAEQLRPQSDFIAAEKLTQQIAPKFNSLIDEQLSAGNRGLNQWVQEPLRQSQMSVEAVSFRTTEARLTGRVLLGQGTIPATSAPLLPVGNSAGAGGSLSAHETFLNSLISIASLSGREIADTDLIRFLSDKGLIEAPPELPGPGKPQFAVLTFAERDACRVSLREGGVELVVRASVQPLIGPMISTRRISIPIEVQLDGESLRLQFGDVQITPDNPAETAGFADPVLDQMLTKYLKPLAFNRKWEVPLTTGNSASLRLKELLLRDGWLVLTVE